MCFFFFTFLVYIDLHVFPGQDDTHTHRRRRGTNHVALRGVDAVSQALDGDPFDGHLGDPPLPVVVAVVDLLGEAEVGHTHVHILIQPETERQLSVCCYCVDVR